jgi:NarL family two-component system sensor histidine kinase LiaS
MIRLRYSPAIFALQYSLLALFTLQALLDPPALTPRWWLILALAIVVAAQMQVWPVRRAFVIPYLLVMAGLLITLTALDQEFMFMVFNFSVTAVMLLPLRRAFLITTAVSLVMLGILYTREGIGEVFYPGLVLITGSYAFGYAFYMRERAEEERERTQRLLDDLREAHRQLEAYTAQAQELAAVEERNRLARELHDSVKQQAFAASAQLGAARSRLEADPAAAAQHLTMAETLLDEVRRELNQLIYELRPVETQGRGLSVTLREWCEGWSRKSGIPLETHIEGEICLSPEGEHAMLRIAQEALANTARHSAAAHVSVRLEGRPAGARLSVCDDGRGFDPALHPSGIGLRSMRERAERLPGGALEVVSAPGEGTRVTVTCAGIETRETGESA